MRPIPPATRTLLHEFEQGPGGGFAPTKYLDPANRWTIAWGHLLTGDDPLWIWDATVSAAEADEIAMKDLEAAAQAVCEGLGSSLDALNDNQYAALIDFTFNEGAGHFNNSTLCRLARQGDHAGVADQFARWIYASGKALPGLQRRRAAEKALWMKPA